VVEGRLSGKVRGVWIILLSILCLGAGLRFYGLDRLPLWNDESIQMTGISMPYPQLVERHIKGIDHMPPFSYVIQRAFWERGKSVRSAKLPGAMAGVAMVLAAFLAFRRPDDPLFGLLAAFFTATSFYLVYYSQELRCYIFFGLGLWLFLGSLLSTVLLPIDARIPAWRWVLLGVWGVLAGSFHYAAQLLFPAAGLCCAAILAIRFLRERGRGQGKVYGIRLLWIFLVLVAVLVLSYLEMNHYMGGKLQGMLGEGRDRPLPPPSLMYDVFLRFSWGNGWRMACFALVAVAGAVLSDNRGRMAMFFAGTLCALSFLLCFYVYPRLGQRPASMMSVRYMFWIAWCTMILSAAGFRAFWMRFRGTRFHRPVAGGLALLYLACMTPAFGHYYRMEAKRMNLARAKAAVEALGGERLLLLENTYDMHHLASSWPTNCTFAALPVYESDDDFDKLRLEAMLLQVAATYPDLVVKRSSFGRPAAMAAFDRVGGLLERRIRVENDVHATKLDAMGLNPMVGKTMEYAYLDGEDLLARVHDRGRPLMLYPARMPLLLVRDGQGGCEPLRVLQQPLDFTVLHAGPATTLHIALPIAMVGSGSVRVEAGGTATMVSVQQAVHQVYVPERKQWTAVPIDLGQLANIGCNLPLRLAHKKIEFDLPVQPGTNHFRMAPFNQPVLFGPPPEEWTLAELLR